MFTTFAHGLPWHCSLASSYHCGVERLQCAVTTVACCLFLFFWWLATHMTPPPSVSPNSSGKPRHAVKHIPQLQADVEMKHSTHPMSNFHTGPNTACVLTDERLRLRGFVWGVYVCVCELERLFKATFSPVVINRTNVVTETQIQTKWDVRAHDSSHSKSVITLLMALFWLWSPRSGEDLVKASQANPTVGGGVAFPGFIGKRLYKVSLTGSSTLVYNAVKMKQTKQKQKKISLLDGVWTEDESRTLQIYKYIHTYSTYKHTWVQISIYSIRTNYVHLLKYYSSIC